MTPSPPARTARPFERVVLATHRFYAAIRHPASANVAGDEPTGGVDDLRHGRNCLVVTYRRDGTPVATPVWYGLDGERLYFRAESASGKAKRVRANPDVRVAPCTARGRPLGPPLAGTARVVTGDEAERAEATIQANHGLVRRLYERWFTLPDGTYVEVTPR